MKLKLDENLPEDLVEPLCALGHDVHTVRDESLNGSPDTSIRAAAAAENRLLITQDVRFADKRIWHDDPGGGIMLVRAGDDKRVSLVSTVVGAFLRKNADSYHGQHTVVTESKVRITPLGRS